jgi:soluble lytic murein transglycosylase-like protein
VIPDRALVIAVAALVGFAALEWYHSTTATTAGDEDSNLLTDTYDDMNNMLTGWPSGSEPYQDLITSAAQANDVPVSILAWLLWKESRYNPAIIDGTRRSRVGAIGIAQFMPTTAVEWLGSQSAALDPNVAIPGAARMLAWLYQQTGTWAEALAGYNWGIGNVQRKGLAAAPAETVDYFTTILGKAGYEVTA